MPSSHDPPRRDALVVGASSGIGREIARELASRGYRVAALARREAALGELAEEAHGVEVLACDTTDAARVNATCAELRERAFDPELLFLCAGRGAPEGDEHPREGSHRATFDTNYFGLLHWVEEWFEPARPRTFVALSSLMALFASPGAAAYCASKAALSSAFESLALTHSRTKHRFVVVHPGPVDTAMLKSDRPLPWTWKPADAARHIVERVLAGAQQVDFCRPYTWVVKSYRLLPASLRRYLLRRR